MTTEIPAAPAVAPPSAPAAAPPPATLLGADVPAADPAKPADPAAAKPAEKPAEKPVTGAPEKYDFKFVEGVTVDAAALDAFSPVLRELNLTQEQAQKLVDIYAGQQSRQVTDFGKKLETEEFATEQAAHMLRGHVDKWAAAVKADKEIGGANFDASVKTSQRAMARFGTPELKQLLNTTGLGNHPALVRFFQKVGSQIKEDDPTYGAGGGSARKSNAEVFYSASGAGA